MERQLTFWKNRLAGSPTLLELPADRARPPTQTRNVARADFRLTTELTDALAALGRCAGASLFSTLLAAFEVLLARFSGQDRFLVCATGPLTIPGQTRHENGRLNGASSNVRLLRGDISGNPRFRDLLRRVHDDALEAFAHPDLPYMQLVEELQPQRDLSYNPLSQVFFNLHEQPVTPFEHPEPGAPSAAPVLPPGLQSSPYDLGLHLAATSNGLAGDWLYSTDLFDAAPIRRPLVKPNIAIPSVCERLNESGAATEFDKDGFPSAE